MLGRMGRIHIVIALSSSGSLRHAVPGFCKRTRPILMQAWLMLLATSPPLWTRETIFKYCAVSALYAG